MNDSDEQYHDFSNVETQRNFLTAEEFPEGPFGSPRGKNKPVENKNTPWRDDQQYYSNLTYEYRNLHEGLPRQFPQAHPTHDDKQKDTEQPYEDSR